MMGISHHAIAATSLPSRLNTSLEAPMLRQAHPLLRTVFEDLVLPNGDTSLEVVDEPPGRDESLLTMRRTSGHDDGKVSDRQWANAVMGRHPNTGEGLGHRSGDVGELGECRRDAPSTPAR